MLANLTLNFVPNNRDAGTAFPMNVADVKPRSHWRSIVENYSRQCGRGLRRQ